MNPVILKKPALTLLGASLAVVLGCAKPPAQELADADGALATAVAAGAEQYAADDLNMAQDALAEAKSLSEAKDYKGAKTAAMDAKTKADAAKAAAEIGKQAAMTEADERMKALEPEVQGAIEAVNKLKGKTADKLKAETVALNDQWTAAKADYDGGQYNTANDKLEDVQSKLDALKTGVAAAKTGIKRK